MGSNDGRVQGITKILDNGPDSSRMNLVVISEGFTEAELASFNNLCDDFVSAIQAENWYATVGKAINIHRLNVESNESGADEPKIGIVTHIAKSDKFGKNSVLKFKCRSAIQQAQLQSQTPP